jgi:hypothetical protein
LNEKELALTWLERAFPAGAIGAFYKDEPVWDTIRNDPRFVTQRTEPNQVRIAVSTLGGNTNDNR